jgi:hypothetical protein
MMTMLRKIGQRTLGPLLVGTLLLGADCSSVGGPAGQQVVFYVDTGFGQGISATTMDVVDLGVPGLYNLSDQSVRLTAVTLVSAPKPVHIRSVTAYVLPPWGALGLGHGNLLRLCRKSDRPYPVTAAVTQPHSEPRWEVVIAFTITKPGRYYLGRAKISYTANGQQGWQYQNLFATITVQAARPGTKPRFDGCL